MQLCDYIKEKLHFCTFKTDKKRPVKRKKRNLVYTQKCKFSKKSKLLIL